MPSYIQVVHSMTRVGRIIPLAHLIQFNGQELFTSTIAQATACSNI